MRKAEFPYESFKRAVEKVPIYTQTELDKIIVDRDKWWIEQIRQIIICTHVNQRLHLWEKLKQEIGL